MDQATRAWRANMAAPLPSISRLNVASTDWATRLNSAIRFTYPGSPSMLSQFDAISQAWRAQISKKLIPLDSFRPLLATFDRLLELLPPNWRDPALKARLTTVIALANAGYPVCWVPRAEVLMALYEAQPDERKEVLIKVRAQILDDCHTNLGQIPATDLAVLASNAQEAVQVLQSGSHHAAQALASNIVDSALRLAIPYDGRGYYSQVVQQIRDTQDAEFAELRRSATLWPVVQALQEFHPHRGDPVPADYNRHASAHAVGAVQTPSRTR